jgi:hypothetical protein
MKGVEAVGWLSGGMSLCDSLVVSELYSRRVTCVTLA